MRELPLRAERLSLNKKQHSRERTAKNIVELELYPKRCTNLNLTRTLNLNFWLVELIWMNLEECVCVGGGGGGE